jgi:hypothetical protein
MPKASTICFSEKGFTVRVPELRSSITLAVTRCEKHGKGVLCLDIAFSLIAGRPRKESQGKIKSPPHAY